jgi:UDP-N-acetylglucosamine 2-epimerase (non-hydrolysing)
MTVFGTRPEAIKMAPLVAMLTQSQHIQCCVVVSAQHREMLDQVLELFNIKPDYDLDIMKQRQSLSHITSKVVEGMEKIIKEENPDIILVHGDTTTTFAAALAAFYQHKKVGHVEAGLRTFNKWFPYPEEMNRKLAGVLADIHFAPTSTAKDNLIREGVDPTSIFVTGNTVIDALFNTVREDYVFKDGILKNLDYENTRVVLVTAHRRENLGEPLEQICMAINELTQEFKNLCFVYPVHYNPAVRETALSLLKDNPGVKLLDPLDTQEMHNLMARSFFVLTDSGGIQEEAPALGKPVLVMRDVTERPEGVKAGTVKVVGVDKENIIKEVKKLLLDENEYNRMAEAVNPYGDGEASIRIVKALLYWFGFTKERPSEFCVE